MGAYTAKGLANKFKAACKGAGLPHCSAHSVRKGTATMIADIGPSEYEIAAFLGDKGLRMAEAKLARNASTVLRLKRNRIVNHYPKR